MEGMSYILRKTHKTLNHRLNEYKVYTLPYKHLYLKFIEDEFSILKIDRIKLCFYLNFFLEKDIHSSKRFDENQFIETVFHFIVVSIK